MRTYLVLSLGCKVNQYEAQQLREALTALGYCRAQTSETPDLCVVNTCTVTAQSDRHCRQLINRLHRHYPQARIFVTGCYAYTDPHLHSRLPGVTGVVPDKQALIRHIAEHQGASVSQPAGQMRSLSFIRHFEGHTRAFLKVQDGCQSFCHYCIVPYVRPRLESKPIPEAINEANALFQGGHQEIVLVGIHLGHYGIDLPDHPGLCDLLEALLQETEVPRYRLSSIEVNEVTADLLAVMSASGRICPHLHLPLQSGDQKVLARMGRNYSPQQFLDKVAEIRTFLDTPALSTDVMVGFPGETEEQFENTVALCRAVGFSRLHIFPYSPRPGTRAAAFPGRVSAQVIARRKNGLKSVADEMSIRFRHRFVGRTVPVLVESKPASVPGLIAGLTPRYLRVAFPGNASLAGNLVNVRLDKLEKGLLVGELVSEM